MASDLSSVGTDDIFEEKEEGEISLEDVSSSEESHPIYRSGFRTAGRCTNCMSTQICGPWCSALRAARKTHKKQDAVHGKENRRHSKDHGSAVSKAMVATLQEKNDDLVPISSDSDMEIVGLPGNSKQVHERSKTAKVRKKRKKKRSHNSVAKIENAVPTATQLETYPEDVPAVKKVHSSRSHHREKSSPRYNARSPEERPLEKSPSRRYRAPRALKSRSPLRRSRSPAARPNVAEGKSPRKVRSPRKSPTRSSLGSNLFRDAREHASLLKRVRRLENVGIGSTKDRPKTKEHSSLKEKLSGMIKNENAGIIEKVSDQKLPSKLIAETNNNKSNDNCAVAATAVSKGNVDDEDDDELLRRLALETKQKKSDNKIEESKKRSENVEESDDDDIEANELRILALRSAMMKKHEKRVTQGIRSKRSTKSHPRVESPFNESFLTDFGISEEDNSSVTTPTTRSSPTIDDERNHPEDMDIDTDVEREKDQDFMPYSPTDDLFREIVVESESPEYDDDTTESETLARDEQYTSPERLGYTEEADTPYSPSAPIETPNADKLVSRRISRDRRKTVETMENLFLPEQSDSNHSLPNSLSKVDTPYSSCMIDKFLSEVRKNHTSTDNPQSPLDTSILDPVLFPIFPDLPSADENIEGISDVVEQENLAHKVEEAVATDILLNSGITTADEMISVGVEAEKVSEICLPLPKENDCETLMEINQECTAVPIHQECTALPIDTIEKLPEIDLDGSPLVSVSAELDTELENLSEILDPVCEPLYLQSLSNVTKASSRIPPLVNRTLVPALILKTNKQLQQPLPQKKVDHPAEPSFKSAEMRPVDVETNSCKLTTLFKPIKLCPIPKKPQVMTSAAAAFNTTLGDETAKETQSDEEPAVVQVPAPVTETQTITLTTVVKSPTEVTSPKADPKLDEMEKPNGKNKTRRDRLRNERKEAKKSVKSAKQERSNEEKSRVSRDSIEKKVKSHDQTSTTKATKRVTRASSKFSLINSRAIVSKSSPINKRTGRRASGAKNDKATLSKKETEAAGDKKQRSPRKKRKSNKNLERLSSNSELLRSKSSEVELPKSLEQRDHKSKDKEETEIKGNEDDVKIPKEEPKTVKEAERLRRSSVDEDEEVLRALLLASLPKRTKPSASPSVALKNPDVTISLPSDTTTGTENLPNKTANKSSVCSVDSALTSVNYSDLPGQSPNDNSGTQAKVETPEPTTKNEEIVRKIFVDQSNGSSGVESMSPRKRANSLSPKGPPKKIFKKVLPVLASTKVVNNAKKYQNALQQKKLNLQRAAVNYRGINGSRNITLNNLKNNDTNRPSSPKISAASKMQRLVINLGSDPDSESDPDDQPTGFINGDIQTETRNPLTIPTTDFEKSVEQFLKDQRKKSESVTVSKQPVSTTKTTATTTAATNSTPTNKIVGNSVASGTGKLTGLYNTPLAVRRHLPVSQQEEYRRLKQQILEHERQKLLKTIENGSVSPNTGLQSPCTPPGPLSPASPIAIQKPQPIQRLSSVAPQLTTSALTASNKNKTLEKSVIEKKIELTKANENKTKVSKTLVPADQIKQQTKTLTVSSKVNSNTFNIPSIAKTPSKILLKSNPNNPSRNNPGSISTPKVQNLISTKKLGSNFVKMPLVNGIASKVENREKSITDMPSTSKKISVQSSTSVSACERARWRSDTISMQSLQTARSTCVGRSPLNATEMLTIRIPNDKLLTDKVALATTSKEDSSASPNSRNVSTLRILTKEQLNIKYGEIQVKQGPTGRTVTVSASSSSSRVDVARSASSSPKPRPCTEPGNDQSSKETLYCDSNLILNESTLSRSDKKRPAESDVLADLEKPTEKRSKMNFTASTIVPVNDNAHNKTNLDARDTTLVSHHDNSECQHRVEMNKMDATEAGTSATSAIEPKQTKTKATGLWDKIKSDVTTELEMITALAATQQKIILTESEEKLVAKRKMVLEDLTEMSGCLRQWETERENQTELLAEVRLLREQLRAAESRLQEQRRQLYSMAPKVTTVHGKINHGRRECYKLSRICRGLGIKIIGEDYKVPDTGAKHLDERLKEVAVQTRQSSKKRVPLLRSPSDSRMNSPDMNSPESSTNSNTIEKSSFEKRLSNPPTPSSGNTSIEETLNLSTSENALDDSRVTKESGEFPEVETSLCPISISEQGDRSTKVEDKSSQAHVPSEENERESNSPKINAETITIIEKSNNSEITGASNSSHCNINDDSDISETNLISTGRNEDISMFRTSKSYPHDQLMATTEKSTVTLKIEPYKSVLTHLKTSRSVNPDGILCPYELMGTCSDGDCQFCHLDPAHCQ